MFADQRLKDEINPISTSITALEKMKKISDRYDKRRFGGNRKIVLNRDNYQCQICWATKDICVHHLRGLKHNDPDDLLVVCMTCHVLIHKDISLVEKM